MMIWSLITRMPANSLKKKLEGKNHSADKVKQVVQQNSNELLKLDKSFFLEMNFLSEHFDAAIEGRMRDLMLECLPRGQEKRALQKAVTATRALSTGPIVMCQRKSVQADMSNAANLLLDISQAQGPAPEEVAKMTIFLQQFIKRAENFSWVLPDGASSSKKAGLFGAEAIQFRMRKASAVPIGHQSQEDMREFRMFRWMLSPSE